MTVDENSPVEQSLRRLFALSLALRLLGDEAEKARAEVEALLDEAAAEVLRTAHDHAAGRDLTAAGMVGLFEAATGERVRDAQQRAELIRAISDVWDPRRDDDADSVAAAALVIGVAVLAAAGAAPLAALAAGAPVLAATTEAVVGALVAGVVVELFRRGRQQIRRPRRPRHDGSAAPEDHRPAPGAPDSFMAPAPDVSHPAPRPPRPQDDDILKAIDEVRRTMEDRPADPPSEGP